jgi:hypothetical protein
MNTSTENSCNLYSGYHNIHLYLHFHFPIGDCNAEQCVLGEKVTNINPDHILSLPDLNAVPCTTTHDKNSFTNNITNFHVNYIFCNNENASYNATKMIWQSKAKYRYCSYSMVTLIEATQTRDLIQLNSKTSIIHTCDIIYKRSLIAYKLLIPVPQLFVCRRAWIYWCFFHLSSSLVMHMLLICLHCVCWASTNHNLQYLIARRQLGY